MDCIKICRWKGKSMNSIKWKLMSKYDRLIDAIKIAKNNHSRLHIMDAGIVLDLIRGEVTGNPIDYSYISTVFIDQVLQEWVNEAKATDPICYYPSDDGTLRIYTSQPGYLIGKSGNLVGKFEKKLREKCHNIKGIHFVEVYAVGRYKL